MSPNDYAVGQIMGKLEGIETTLRRIDENLRRQDELIDRTRADLDAIRQRLAAFDGGRAVLTAVLGFLGLGALGGWVHLAGLALRAH